MSRRSIRLKGYDYSSEGLYFITICTKDRIFLFGEIENNKMILNKGGQIANQYWLEIPKHFPNVVLHEFIVMPNHVHGIIEITNLSAHNNVAAENFVVAAENVLPLHVRKHHQQNQFQKMIPRSIGSIVKGYKIGVTKWFRNFYDKDFIVWQRNYFEYIIKDNDSYKTISNYILNNPAKWTEDKFINNN